VVRKRRAGRSLYDIDELLASRTVEVPSDEHALKLILADDATFDAALLKILASRNEQKDELAVAEIVAGLRRPSAPEKTISECHQHAVWMADIMNDAIGLVRRHGTLKAAFAAQPESNGAKAIGFFMRMKPEQGSSAALRAFDTALRDYQHDSAALDPCLKQCGSRTLGSFKVDDRTHPGTEPNPGAFVQRIREARYAARQIPGLLAKIRVSLPKPVGLKFLTVPIEDAKGTLENAAETGHRIRVAKEIRQLRELFAETGFGDALTAPADFETRVKEAGSRVHPSVPSSGYDPQILDLLLDLTKRSEHNALTEWPDNLARARNDAELTEIATSSRQFDVVVVDDASGYAPELLVSLAAAGARVHRIGVAKADDAICLDLPHRQLDATVAEIALGRLNQWLGSPDAIGVVVRTAPHLTIDQLRALANQLAQVLRSNGYDALISGSREQADLVVTSLGELRDADLPAIAGNARNGVVALCCFDFRTAKQNVDLPPSQTPDIALAQSLGWKVTQVCPEGTVLEKEGRLVVLVEETVVLGPEDGTIADDLSRLSSLGWRPIVAWHGSPRTPEELVSLLDERAVRPDHRIHEIVDRFELTPPEPPDDETSTDAMDAIDSAHASLAAAPVAAHDALSLSDAVPISDVERYSEAAPQADTGDNDLTAAANEIDVRADEPIAEAIPFHAKQHLSTHLKTTVQTLPPLDETIPTELSAANPQSDLAEEATSPEGTRVKLRLAPTVLDNIRIIEGAQRLAIPHAMRVLASMALQTEYADPICIVLPSTEYVAQTVAILAALQCLAADFAVSRQDFLDRYLKPGASVRILPDGNVFVVCEKTSVLGMDGVYLGYTDKETLDGRGKRLVPTDQLFRYEPTTRILPKSRASIKFNSANPTDVDEMAGVVALGNSGLYRNRVVVVGSRAEFERVLDRTTLVAAASAGTDGTHSPLSAQLAWGTFDEAGRPFVLSPEGSAGCPLVAIARDFSELEQASLAPGVDSGSQIVLTDRFDLVLNNLDLANRVGERQRLIVFADARRRADAVKLRRQGWKVWEPSPSELLSGGMGLSEPSQTGFSGLDRSMQSAFKETRPSVGFLPKSAPALAEAYRRLNQLDEALTSESAVDDLQMQASLESARGLFFRAANWLSVPMVERAEQFSIPLEQLRSSQGYISRYLGPDAGSAVEGFIDALERFVTTSEASGKTPKGDALLQLARNALLHPSLKQVLVTGSRQSREEAESFLSANGVDFKCKLANELADADGSPRVISFSILRRDIFEKFMDPWPSKAIMMAGYEFEVEIYKKRLRWRDSLKRRLGLNSDVRTALTSMPAASFGPNVAGATFADAFTSDPIPEEQAADPFDRLSGSRSGNQRPIQLPSLTPGEETEDCRMVGFVGRSWMPMASDYRPLCIMNAGNEGKKSGVEHIDMADLRAGMRIIVREGGEKDVIKAIAQDT
jgi:hypothetical protein